MTWALLCLTRNIKYNLWENCQHIVGRGRGCLIKCESLYASKYHCLITTKGEIIYIVDAESANGTYINGIAIESRKSYLLKENDIIGIGVRNEFCRGHAVFRLIKVDDLHQGENPMQCGIKMQLDDVNYSIDEEAISAIFASNINIY